MTAKRYHDLDALRAFAMLLGILLHGMISFISTAWWPTQDVNQNELYRIPITAIHGFRMPLFFFISGLFTMMMWRKYGTLSLLANRFKRIALPLVLSVIVIIPLWIQTIKLAEWKYDRREKIEAAEKPVATSVDKEATNLWETARTGEVERIEGLMQEGVDPSQKDDKQNSALHWAGSMGKEEVIEVLIESGAKVNALDKHLSTPLHFAAFWGQPESVKILLEKDTDPELWNEGGEQPRASTKADRKLTDLVAGKVLSLPLAFEKVEEGRKEVIELLGAPHPRKADNWFASNYLIGKDGKFRTIHLWFLYDLIYLVAGFVILANVLKCLFLSSFVAWLAESSLRLLWLIPLTYWAQFSMAENFGPDNYGLLEPNWIKLGYYAIFFGYGAVCFGHSGFIKKVGRWWPLYFLLSIIACFIAMSLMKDEHLESKKEIISFAGACYVWLMIFGMIGVFRKFFSKENPKIRYLSDSAYWLYLAHFPIIHVIQIWVSEWQFPSLIKLIFICVVPTALLLLSYHYLIRYTWVGTLLNGKRTKPQARQATLTTN